VTGSGSTRHASLHAREAARLGAACIALLVLCASTPGRVEGAIVSARATIDRSVVLRGEPVVVTVTVESSGFDRAEVTPPVVPGWTFERSGTSENLVIAIGNVMRTDATVYRVFVPEPGKYVLPPMRARSGKQVVETARVPFEIVRSLPSADRAAGQGKGSQESAPIFARFVVDRRRAYWNEQIVGRMQIFSRSPLAEMPAWAPPLAAGFWGEPMGEATHDRVSVNGNVYERYERRMAFFPTRTGTLTLGPARALARVALRDAAELNALRSPFLMPPTARFVEIPVEAAPVQITVAPLPAGAPQEFQGAVGDLSLTVRVDRAQGRAGEPITVSTTIAGEGNLASAVDPALVAVPAFPSYPAGARTDLDRSADRLRGSRLREMAFVPDRPGSLVVLPIAFSWFDPEFGRYRVQRSDSIVVRVGPAPPGSPLTAERARSATAVPAPPRSGKGRSGPLDGWPTRPPLFVGAASMIAYAGWGFLTVRRRRAARDPRRRRYALLGAALETIERAVGDVRASGAADAVERALRESAGLRCGVDLEGRSRREVAEALRTAGMPDDALETLSSVLLRLEAASFAPGAETGWAGVAQDAVGLVRRWREECVP